MTLTKDGFLLVTTDRPAKAQSVSVPPELYLRQVHDLAGADDAAILDFVSRYGTPKLRKRARLLSAVWGTDCASMVREASEPRPETLVLLTRELNTPPLRWWLLDADIRDRAARARIARLEEVVERVRTGDSERLANSSGSEVDEGLSSHVDEFRAIAALLRDLSRVWQCATGQLAWEELPALWESPFRPDAEVAPSWPDEDQALRVLAAAVNDGLSEFTVRIQVHEAEPTDSSPWSDEPHGLYPVLCLQLANHIAERAVYLRCQNPTCGRLYVRPEGRATHGKEHTKSTRYCSARCNRAVAQRRFRKRKRYAAAHRGGDPSSSAETLKTTRERPVSPGVKTMKHGKPDMDLTKGITVGRSGRSKSDTGKKRQPKRASGGDAA